MRRATICVALVCLGGLAVAAPATLGEPEPGATPDAAATTPAATPGTQAAARTSLARPALRQRLADAMRSAGGQGGAWVFHMNGPDRPVVFARNAGTRRILASNQKLYSTAAALERFGAGHRFSTEAYARGTRRGPNDRVLDGNLVIRGDGDPALATNRFATQNGFPATRIGDLAREIRRAGIRRITGTIRADDTIFDRRRGTPATGWRPSPWLSPLSGLSFNSGFGASGYAASPELEAARQLRRALVQRDVRVGGGIGRAGLPRRFLNNNDPLATIGSPPLATLAAATNKPSNNFFAEMLLKRVGSGPKVKGTTRRGARRSQRIARRLNTGVQASDGSGLGRANRATPKQVGKLLRSMTRTDSAQAFTQSLAIAGRDGTLRSRMRGTAAEARCRGKTGTLSGVSALSGYCNARNGRVVFSILMNGVDATRARNAQDRMVTAIARYAR